MGSRGVEGLEGSTAHSLSGTSSELAHRRLHCRQGPLTFSGVGAFLCAAPTYQVRAKCTQGDQSHDHGNHRD